jgi:hypothetical protein
MLFIKRQQTLVRFVRRAQINLKPQTNNFRTYYTMSQEQPQETLQTDNKEQIVTPWDVSTDAETGIDYLKLVHTFGSQLIDQNLIDRIAKVTSMC